MDVNQFLCQEGSDKYTEAVELNDIASQNDPENDPFKSKYKAREIWMGLTEELACNGDKSPEENEETVFLLAVLHFRIGTNFTETEELSSGQEQLTKCIELLEPIRLKEKACNSLQVAYNQMGILWTTRRQPNKALDFLQKAEQLYSDYKAEIGSSPFMLEELFNSKDGEDEGSKVQKRCENFEHCYTLTLYYLAQVYAKLEENSTSAKYCHVTLRRQLESGKYDPLDWALNAATLSQYYVTADDRKMARHCLASAQRVLLELGEPNMVVTINEEDNQTDVDRKEKIPRCWADLYRCWVKFGLSLLDDSMANLIEKARIEDVEKPVTDHNSDKTCAEETKGQQLEDGATSCSEIETQKLDGAGACSISAVDDVEGDTKKDSMFFKLELTSIEDQISDEFARDFEEARKIFLQVQKWITEAKQFYLLDGHCTDHVELIQDHSKLFKLLAFFDLDFERQCKMHKRRVDMLQDILKDLSQQYYLLVCRQLMYEIAETYSTMLDLKLAVIEDTGIAPNPHGVKKINTLTEQSIGMYTRYIDTLRTPEKTLPDQFSSDDERPALVAYFCMGRLHGKFLGFEPGQKLENMKRSRDCYKFLVDYCDKNESGKERVITEYEICSEMVTLMPYKMQRISSQII